MFNEEEDAEINVNMALDIIYNSTVTRDGIKYAFELLNDALRVKPNNYYVLNGMGAFYFKINKYLKAIEYFNSALRENPNYGEAKVGKVLCLNEMGFFDESIKIIDEMIETNPDDKKLLIIRAGVEKEMGYHEKVIDSIKQSLEIDSEDILINKMLEVNIREISDSGFEI